MADQDETGVEIKLWFFPLAFFLFACTPRIQIDGKTYKRYWGTHFFDLAPGRHKVTIYFPYIFMPRCGENSVTIELEHDEVVCVSYFMPPWVFAKGFLSVS
ncbi:MAG: hypothetical protein KDA88_02400 [Planctomycetaceae bacterium]|nr:hypothetical protein [Planctomycetaceae bacterium]MCB9952916.1 hypothetical protein [Planctomycetaceae bacterium]